ncbi:hypothetical protein [Aquimarina megaterium]|uniref:hypothetical protein n=1 Tax=Aquimarina megaterium TaxID=1443666 RepID=UPI0011126372|nr:hypothetical protein [Aquimarina megaterium]
MSRRKPKTQVNYLEDPNKKIIFFLDSNLKVEAKFDINSSTYKVVQIKFDLTCNNKTKYKIISINPCPKKRTIFYMIHLLETTNVEYKNSSHTTKPEEIKDMEMYEYAFVRFMFNIHRVDPGQINPKMKCKFNEATPESKDGSIIIGG